MLSTVLFILALLNILIKYAIVTFLIIFIILTVYRFTVERKTGPCKCPTKLNGKVVLITGGNSGIGLETAKDLAERGARVIIASRDIQKSEEAVAMIKQTTRNDNVEYRLLDLAKKSSIVEFATKFNEDFDRLDILVNNAGCGFARHGNTEDGVDVLMQINYVGPFLLTNLLLDKIVASKPSRIINVSSLGHKHGSFNSEDLTNYKSSIQFIRYAKSKLFDILWTRELAKRLPIDVTVNAVHPGIVKTNIFNALHPITKKMIFLIIDIFFKTSLEGAQTIIHLCVSKKLENSTGGYYEGFKEVQPSKTAQDFDLAEKLWYQTMDLISR